MKEELLEEFIKVWNSQIQDQFTSVYVCEDCLSTDVKTYYNMVSINKNTGEYDDIGEYDCDVCNECGEYIELIEVENIEEYKELLKEKDNG
ncbi:hypothetical protein [Carboxylicivirga sp. M1479]|uniref:hypothetical protein n=1 Tax=Carboxylicivirga sp. M1479 TaxID=2594476 RepID=UPI0011784893|nr:hypothetical protein [Carboxylicivirga sp. M1479]TRX71529.1 hypothetical protein FNN09_06040 [Carboxylicivirga sp. M1479]